jgi:hypothetical protein
MCRERVGRATDLGIGRETEGATRPRQYNVFLREGVVRYVPAHGNGNQLGVAGLPCFCYDQGYR